MGMMEDRMEEQQQLDLELLEDIRSGIEQDAPDLSDYLMLSELSRVTHLKHQRIWYAITTGKKRPLFGVKRGDRWFVHRLDALTWAADVATDQQERWLQQAQRLGKLVRKEQIRQGVIPPEQRQARDPLPRVPAGILTYSYAEAARMLNLSMSSVKIYLGKGQPLEKITRYRTADGRTVLSARDVNDAVLERKRKEDEKTARDRQTKQRRAVEEAASNVRELRRGAA